MANGTIKQEGSFPVSGLTFTITDGDGNAHVVEPYEQKGDIEITFPSASANWGKPVAFAVFDASVPVREHWWQFWRPRSALVAVGTLPHPMEDRYE